MSGLGQRFVNEGYTKVKPLIRVGKQRIIQHVISMFPANCTFIFICREEHLQSTEMRRILQESAPGCQIYSVPGHKLGPAYAIESVKEYLIDIDDEVIVSYCDYFSAFSYQSFETEKELLKPDGIIFTYTGFHPHMLNEGNYAFVRKNKDEVTDIREKESFTSDKMGEEASSGMYYFRSVNLLLSSIEWIFKNDLSKNGEYYISLAYHYLFEKRLKVKSYVIDQMLQWGTPEDLNDYCKWRMYFLNKQTNGLKSVWVDQLVIAMAGEGTRFASEGYDLPKPFLPVDNLKMWELALMDMPSSLNTTLILQEKHKYHISSDCQMHALNGVTNGQATSVYDYVQHLDSYSSLFISAVDQVFRVNPHVFENMVRVEKADIIVFTARKHHSAIISPEMFGWIRSDDFGCVTALSVKKPIDDKYKEDSIIVGSFYFRTANLYKELYQELVDDQHMINGEYYIDSMVKIAQNRRELKILELPTELYLSLGIPSDYETYRYWENYFKRS